jgi:3-dehydroquinate synthase
LYYRFYADARGVSQVLVGLSSKTSLAGLPAWYKKLMPTYVVETPQRKYSAIVERGVIGQAAKYIPSKTGKVFVVTTADVWKHAGAPLAAALAGVPFEVLNLPGGEDQKRLAPVEQLAEEMVQRGADRSSMVIAYGGGIVTDMGGFLAAIFMRGIPVLQIPTTLLAQVDAAIGGKTGVNLVSGKNLIGSFHQPLAVLTDPAVLDTLPDREYRAGLYEIIKAGIIREPELFRYLAESSADVLARKPAAVDHIIAESVRMKAEVVSSDEREGDMRRILNFGHTFGHALEAETEYKRLLHGEAVAWGMRAAIYLGQATGYVSSEDAVEMLAIIADYGPIPGLDGIRAENLVARLVHDKKTVQGKVHFVLPVRVGEVIIVSGVDDKAVLEAIRSALL